MAITRAFEEAVSSDNIRRVRIMMKDSLLNDLTFSEFDMMQGAACVLSGLYDTHDGRELNDNKSMWNDSYMNELMVQIVGNFSHERVEHLKEVVKHLRPVAIHSKELQSKNRSFSKSEKPSGQTYTNSTDHQRQKYHDQQNGSDRGTKIACGAIIGAVAGGTIAAVASVSIISGVAIGAVAGAVAATVMAKGER